MQDHRAGASALLTSHHLNSQQSSRLDHNSSKLEKFEVIWKEEKKKIEEIEGNDGNHFFSE